VNVSDIQDVIETTLGGKQGTELWEGEKKFGVVVKLPADERKDKESIKRILIETPTGARIRLSELATVSDDKSGKVNISRELGLRVAAIGIFIDGRDMGSLVKEMQEKIGKLSMPAGYFVTYAANLKIRNAR